MKVDVQEAGGRQPDATIFFVPGGPGKAMEKGLVKRESTKGGEQIWRVIGGLRSS